MPNVKLIEKNTKAGSLSYNDMVPIDSDSGVNPRCFFDFGHTMVPILQLFPITTLRKSQHKKF